MPVLPARPWPVFHEGTLGTDEVISGYTAMEVSAPQGGRTSPANSG